MSLQILVFLVSTLALLLTIGIVLRRTVFRNDALTFWKDVGVPLATPLVITLLGVAFGYLTEGQKTYDSDNQKKGELLREVVASNDRPDIAFVTAVGDRLVMHLKRRNKILDQLKDTIATEPARKELQNAEDFEDRAAYFFFGMFHSALIDFYATKGYQLYPRLWMESAFYGLCDHVDALVYGVKYPRSEMPGIEESALYKYFGAAAATFKNITDLPGEPKKAAILFDFNLMISHPAGNISPSKDDQQQLEEVLRQGYKDFQNRLNSAGPRAINVNELLQTIAAITALDDYAFNKLFGVWYKGSNTPNRLAEVKSLDEEIPAVISRDPPTEYLFYPLRGWEDENLQELRKHTWQIIFDQTPKKFRLGAR